MAEKLTSEEITNVVARRMLRAELLKRSAFDYSKKSDGTGILTYTVNNDEIRSLAKELEKVSIGGECNVELKDIQEMLKQIIFREMSVSMC